MERSRRGAVRSRPFPGRQTLGLFLIAAIGLPFLGDFVGDPALADLIPPPHSTVFGITSPGNNVMLGEGNLVLIEGTTAPGDDGGAEQVEVALGNDDTWVATDVAPDDPTRWRFLWSDPAPGFHRIRARSRDADGEPAAEQSIIVQVPEASSAPFSIDNPYATPGSFRKGQLHFHSSSSFDGHGAMPPAQNALAYKRRGYDFVMITDHDVISYPRDIIDETFTLLRGYESTADSGHIVALDVDRVAPANWRPQSRIDHINETAGLAILAHPAWAIGWKDVDMTALQGYRGMEIYNGFTDAPGRTERALQLWHAAVNAKGYTNRIWAVAVDDSHTPEQMNRGWVMVKAARLTPDSIRRSIEKGAFYSSTGPSFSALGVMNGAIVASSPEASRIRFIDQDMNVVWEAPSRWADYRPSGVERWVRVEAVSADGKTAWSQPFWILPNAPLADLVPSEAGITIVGKALPGSRVHASNEGQYLGSAVANVQGTFQLSVPAATSGRQNLSLVATSPWPDQLNGSPALLSYEFG